MHNALARRTFLGRLVALPILGAGFSIFARSAHAATASILRQIEEAERRYRAARRAWDVAHAAFEASFPKLHPTLDLTGQRPRRFAYRIERGFNGSPARRCLDRFGQPDSRYVATVESLTEDLAASPYGPRGKVIRRMLRRARKHEAAVEQAEDAFRLADLEADLDRAKQAVHELAEAIFAQPATTLPEIRVQARMLRTFVASTPEQWAGFQAGKYGETLATNLDGLAA